MIIQQKLYDGSLIHTPFAYKFFRDKISSIGNIVAFRAPMRVTTNLIDLEDSLKNDFIYSSDAINFCWEIYNMNALGAVCFQRYFNTKLAELLSYYSNNHYTTKGDDIMVDLTSADNKKISQKASVSITYSQNNIAIGHTGINIIAGPEAPSFAYSTHLNELEIAMFVDNTVDLFNNSINDMAKATTKVII